MNNLKKLLITAAAVSALGLVRAQAGGTITDATTAGPADSASRSTSGISTSYSFAEIVSWAEGAQQAGDPAGPVRAGTFAELSNVPNAMPKPIGGTHSTTSLLGEVSAINGAFGELSAMDIADELFASRPAASRLHADARFLFAAADMPEPTDWMTLLCGVVVVAFMARRKRSSFAE